MSIRILNYLPKRMKKDILPKHFRHYLKNRQLSRNLDLYLTATPQYYYHNHIKDPRKSLVVALIPSSDIYTSMLYQYKPYGGIVDFLHEYVKAKNPDEIYNVVDLDILKTILPGELIQCCSILAQTGKLSTLEITGYPFDMYQNSHLVRTLIKNSLK